MNDLVGGPFKVLCDKELPAVYGQKIRECAGLNYSLSLARAEIDRLREQVANLEGELKKKFVCGYCKIVGGG